MKATFGLAIVGMSMAGTTYSSQRLATEVRLAAISSAVT